MRTEKTDKALQVQKEHYKRYHGAEVEKWKIEKKVKKKERRKRIKKEKRREKRREKKREKAEKAAQRDEISEKGLEKLQDKINSKSPFAKNERAAKDPEAEKKAKKAQRQAMLESENEAIAKSEKVSERVLKSIKQSIIADAQTRKFLISEKRENGKELSGSEIEFLASRELNDPEIELIADREFRTKHAKKSEEQIEKEFDEAFKALPNPATSQERFSTIASVAAKIIFGETLDRHKRQATRNFLLSEKREKGKILTEEEEEFFAHEARDKDSDRKRQFAKKIKLLDEADARVRELVRENQSTTFESDGKKIAKASVHLVKKKIPKDLEKRLEEKFPGTQQFREKQFKHATRLEQQATQFAGDMVDQYVKGGKGPSSKGRLSEQASESKRAADEEEEQLENEVTERYAKSEKRIHLNSLDTKTRRSSDGYYSAADEEASKNKKRKEVARVKESATRAFRESEKRWAQEVNRESTDGTVLRETENDPSKVEEINWKGQAELSTKSRAKKRKERAEKHEEKTDDQQKKKSDSNSDSSQQSGKRQYKYSKAQGKRSQEIAELKAQEARKAAAQVARKAAGLKVGDKDGGVVVGRAHIDDSDEKLLEFFDGDRKMMEYFKKKHLNRNSREPRDLVNRAFPKDIDPAQVARMVRHNANRKIGEQVAKGKKKQESTKSREKKTEEKSEFEFPHAAPVAPYRSQPYQTGGVVPGSS